MNEANRAEGPSTGQGPEQPREHREPVSITLLSNVIGATAADGRYVRIFLARYDGEDRPDLIIRDDNNTAVIKGEPGWEGLDYERDLQVHEGWLLVGGAMVTHRKGLMRREALSVDSWQPAPNFLKRWRIVRAAARLADQPTEPGCHPQGGARRDNLPPPSVRDSNRGPRNSHF